MLILLAEVILLWMPNSVPWLKTICACWPWAEILDFAWKVHCEQMVWLFFISIFTPPVLVRGPVCLLQVPKWNSWWRIHAHYKINSPVIWDRGIARCSPLFDKNCYVEIPLRLRFALSCRCFRWTLPKFWYNPKPFCSKPVWSKKTVFCPKPY